MILLPFEQNDNESFYIKPPKDWASHSVCYSTSYNSNGERTVIRLNSFSQDLSQQSDEFKKKFYASIAYTMVSGLWTGTIVLSQKKISEMTAEGTQPHLLQQFMKSPSSSRHWSDQGDFLRALKNANDFLEIASSEYLEIITEVDKNFRKQIFTALQIGDDSQRWALGSAGLECHFSYLERLISFVMHDEQYPHLKNAMQKGLNAALDVIEKRIPAND